VNLQTDSHLFIYTNTTNTPINHQQSIPTYGTDIGQSSTHLLAEPSHRNQSAARHTDRTGIQPNRRNRLDTHNNGRLPVQNKAPLGGHAWLASRPSRSVPFRHRNLIIRIIDIIIRLVSIIIIVIVICVVERQLHIIKSVLGIGLGADRWSRATIQNK
jgi:hypothetical protein